MRGRMFPSLLVLGVAQLWPSHVSFADDFASARRALILQTDANRQVPPVAGAYRRLIFLLNLKPAPWDDIAVDLKTIEESAAPSRLDAFRAEVAAAFGDLEAEARVSSPTNVMRRSTAERVFVAATRIVGDTVAEALDSAVNFPSDRETVEHAQRLWMAFAHEVEQTDPSHAPRFGSSENQLASFASASSYVRQVFGDLFSVEGMETLSPLPRLSATYLPSAVVPPLLPPATYLVTFTPTFKGYGYGAVEFENDIETTGKRAFEDPALFGEPARSLGISCATCHYQGGVNPAFFVPGLSSRMGGVDPSNSFFSPHGGNGLFDPLDIPDLHGIRQTPPYGRNGRIASLAEFTRNVVVEEFGGVEPGQGTLDALIAYMDTFAPETVTHLGTDGRLSPSSPRQALRGEAIFNRPFAGMDGMSCASCHVPATFFVDGKSHNLGTAAKGSVYAMDEAFDTPTLRNAAKTAPYFHDGRLPTLRSVTEWFNERYTLWLDAAAIDDLTAYVCLVGGGDAASGAVEP